MTPASIRNYNPGAMEPGFASKRFGSTTHEKLTWVYTDPKTGAQSNKTNLCATFPTHVHGGAAMFVLLSEGKPYRNKTIEEAISTWCGGYWASDYLDHMYEATGLTQKDVLTPERIRDPKVSIPICQAIARWERGKSWPMDQLDWAGWQQAHDMAFGSGLAPAPTPDNDVPFQKPEGKAREAWASIVRKVKYVTGAITGGGLLFTMDQIPTVPAPPPQLKQSFVNLGQWSDAVPYHQWQMLGLGAAVFVGVALVMSLTGKTR